MWLNMKPYSHAGSTAVPYTVGISKPNSFPDQKRNLVKVKPGKHLSIKIMPDVVTSTSEFNGLDLAERKCKHSHETDGLKFLNEYSRVGCELECALNRSISLCECLPWFYPNDFTSVPVCDMFGGYYFDQIMSDNTYYKSCSTQCLEDCEEVRLLVLPTIFPIDEDELCRDGNLLQQHFQHGFSQHFAFNSYQVLVKGKSQPDLYTSFKNGSLCKDYLRNFAALVSVESPTDTVIRSERVIRLSFFDKLSQVGGILALCAGLSVMSSFELVFFVINLVMIFFKMICRICGIFKSKIQDYDMERELTDDELQMFFIRSHVSLTFHIYLSHSKYLNLSTFYFFFSEKT